MESLLIYASDTDSDGDPAESSSETLEGVTTIQDTEPERFSSLDSHPIQQNSVSLPFPATTSQTILPPPPEDLLPPGRDRWHERLHDGRIRSFPHVEGNYALHVYIPVTLPSYASNEVRQLIQRALKAYPGLRVLEEDLAEPSVGDYGGMEVHSRSSERLKLDMEYHISLSRTVPIRIHHIESITSMLRRKFSSQNRYLAGFDSWEVFTNDEKTRTFLSLEITTAGLLEIQKQVTLVDDVFRLHNLPTFYKDPRPHISLAWALGEVSSSVQRVANELNKVNASLNSVGGKKGVLWLSQVRKVDCKVGQRVYTIWASPP
ncbi:unnamed protein product [Calypogeia fissa]